MNRTRLDRTQKRNFIILLLMALIVLVIFGFPNSAASSNVAMVQVFQPDEANPLPTVFHMIEPADSIKQVAKNFILYGYYPYGLLYFGLSALVVLPLRLLGLLQNTTLVMLLLREVISVLPILVAILILVYLQDEFRTYRSFVLFAFLAAIPAVVANNLWWHPDGLLIMFMTLALFFIYRDKLRFGVNYYLAAVMIGMAAAVKITGVYFFLVVGLTLLLGLVQKKKKIPALLLHAVGFILLMAATYVVLSPFLFFSALRGDFIKSMINQSSWIQEGYGLIYAKGIAASWPLVHQYYGEIVFLVVTFICLLYGMIWGKRKTLYGLILALFIPLSVTVFFISHFKFQYWLPAMLPVMSCLVLVLPPFHFEGRLPRLRQYFFYALLAIITLQFGLFVKADVNTYLSSANREANNSSIQFYKETVNALSPVRDLPLTIYYDPRVYLPKTGQWTKSTTYDLLDYGYIEENHFAVLLLMQQRILDYTNPNAVGIHPAQFAENQKFYNDAKNGAITGYQQVFEDGFGRVFVRDDLYQEYFGKP